MPFNIYFLLHYCIILCNEFYFSNARAMIGQNVRQARESEFPFIVALSEYNKKETELVRFCTGALVSNRDVLTSEHCIENKEMTYVKIIVGSNDLSRGIKFDADWWLSYNQWALYKDIEIEFRKNDIAVMRLSNNVPDNIKPGVLSSVANQDLYGMTVTVAGWGNSNTGEIPKLMETMKLKVLTNAECEDRAKMLQGKGLQIHERLLCTADTPYALLNYGDSGDPVLYNNEIVAVSYGTYLLREIEFHPHKVNLHFGINYYKNFILSVINNF